MKTPFLPPRQTPLADPSCYVTRSHLKWHGRLVAIEYADPPQVLSKLRLDADLNDVVLVKYAVVLAHKPARWGRITLQIGFI